MVISSLVAVTLLPFPLLRGLGCVSLCSALLLFPTLQSFAPPPTQPGTLDTAAGRGRVSGTCFGRCRPACACAPGRAAVTGRLGAALMRVCKTRIKRELLAHRARAVHVGPVHAASQSHFPARQSPASPQSSDALHFSVFAKCPLSPANISLIASAGYIASGKVQARAQCCTMPPGTTGACMRSVPVATNDAANAAMRGLQRVRTAAASPANPM